MLKSLVVVLLTCSLLPLHAEDTPAKGYEPLYAGTLLSLFPFNAAPGYLAVQPYIFATDVNGFYNKDWSFKKQKSLGQLALFVSLETGITKFLDITVYLTGSYNFSRGRHSLVYEDTQVLLGSVLSKDKKGTWIPDFRVLLEENFPTGKYDHLNPNKNGADIGGIGTYQTGFIIVTRKIFYTFPSHPYNFNLNLYYLLSTKTKVKDFSIFGGGFGTRGVVSPGNQFIGNLGIEFSINRNFVLGTDIHYEHHDKSPFHGKPGVLKDGTIAKVGLPSTDRWSLAPCLEYSYSDALSLAGGVWFTVAGRNVTGFVSGVFNVYYYF